MPTCSHCGEEFDDESAHASHLLETHADELSRLDRRRAEATAENHNTERPSFGRIAQFGIPIVLGIVVIGFLYTLFGTGAGGPVDTGAAREPTNLWSEHYHGTIDVRILGDTIDFSQPQYQLQADAFHFEEQNGQRWHIHAKGVTLEFAMATLGFDVNHTSITIDGSTYSADDPGYAVSIAVNERDVDPRTYVLQPGDHITISVTETESAN